MKGMIAALLSTLAAFLLPAQAENNAAPTSVLQAAEAAKGRGALYRVHHEGRVAWLFGTIHVGRPEFGRLGPEVERALAQANRLVLELDIRNDVPLQDALSKHGLYGDGDGIENHISPDTLARLEQTIENYGMSFARVRQMKPWLVANLLMGLDLDRHGYRRQYAAEYGLLAAVQGKSVRELETVEYQMSLFNGMDNAAQEVYLREALDELGNGKALTKARILIDAWLKADGDAMERFWTALLAEGSHTTRFTQRVLMDQRNPEMADKVESLLREDGSSFVGVGLLHLIGKGGLPALLRQRGYTVERVY